MGLYVIHVYIINRVSYFFHELLKPFIYYDYSHHYFEITTNNINYFSDIYSVLVYLIPFNPFFIIGWFPIILLNAVLVIISYRIPCEEGSIAMLKHSFSAILLLYISATIIFALMSGANNYNSTLPNSNYFLFEIFLECYTPYAPQLICGFMFGNVISVLIFLFIRFSLNKLS